MYKCLNFVINYVNLIQADGSVTKGFEKVNTTFSINATTFKNLDFFEEETLLLLNKKDTFYRYKNYIEEELEFLIHFYNYVIKKLKSLKFIQKQAITATSFYGMEVFDYNIRNSTFKIEKETLLESNVHIVHIIENYKSHIIGNIFINLYNI